MATTTRTARKTAASPIPEDPEATGAPTPEDDLWATAEVLAGVDVLDKAELVNVPFVVTGIKITVNSRDIVTAWVEGQRRDRTKFTFIDTSTGVKAQVDNYLAEHDLAGTLDEWINIKPFIAPRGLRVSNYEVKDERGKTRPARTYYFTTSGERA